ncbi:hypothetical protein PAXINDRAFT_181240 [Paxillus involutus ATCC 200175]|uniref:Uncharacterized protein n=1 Tax=Paxillus involutus ATCC 200175 TaxID=664439 RepID=A0A0C9U2B0_PAXIN|nr:hypothetical protein PAXINDRAFT_181240 [Paxillus involutus ATCC 200175]
MDTITAQNPAYSTSLYEHVKDDNTWLRAFLNQFLSISPERELENEKILPLRRMENTWRKEFILRYSFRRHPGFKPPLIRRWERSRNPTVTHTPQDSSIDGLHLMSDKGLLTSSIQYGTVARSLPLSGKILKGYIDASGTGLGIGNPNVEFTPNVSACAMSSDGGTARVFWGKRNGEVAVTVANKVMDSGRAVPRFIRCSVNDQHEGAVQQLLPDPISNTLVSAGADGRINLWDLRTLGLMWSSGKQQVSLVTDPVISITGSLSEGFIAGALNSGDILLFNLEAQDTTGEPLAFALRQLRVTAPIHGDEHQPPVQMHGSEPEPRIAKTWLYRSTESGVSIFVQYYNHSLLYRIFADIQSGKMTTTSFGDSSFSNVSVVELVTSIQERDGNTMIIGDHLGFISIYDADVPLSSQSSITPVHRFEAHTDGGVTAISWSPMVFATGSARGTTTVWDSLTLEPLRYFMSPAPRPAPGHDWASVSQVLLDKELVVIIVGNRAMTWNLGQASGREHKPKKTKHSHSKKSLTSKGQKQCEMHKDIAESFGELEYERAHVQRIYGREREHRSTLDSLGLSELEAVEYVLMLSRQEEEERQLRMAREEGVFEGDFDDLRVTTIHTIIVTRLIFELYLSFARPPVSPHCAFELERESTDSLGLSELEAVEYVLMLSRQEEEERQLRMAREEGVFEGDFDDLRVTTIHTIIVTRLIFELYLSFARPPVSPHCAFELERESTGISALRSRTYGGRHKHQSAKIAGHRTRNTLQCDNYA